MAFRTIARDTDERTLIFSLLPRNCNLGHSLFTNTPKRYGMTDSELTHLLRSFKVMGDKRPEYVALLT